MHFRKYFIVFLLLIFVNSSYAQQTVSTLTDAIIVFKVFGACEQCKTRIELVAKGKGVRMAIWEIDTNQFTVQFDSSKTSLEKIQNRIVAAGHDLINKKAKEAVYQALPACCQYREMEKTEPVMITDSSMIIQNMLIAAKKDSLENVLSSLPTGIQSVIKGVVVETNKKGVFTPLVGASIVWLHSQKGVTTDSTGTFQIKNEGSQNKLVVSYTGYQSDSLTVLQTDELKIILAANKQLHEVTITAKMRSTYIAALNPIRTQIMTEKELFKAACCNLSESFETNPSVDVSYNDAVTGSKQIQLLGLSGNYTQLTVENLPGPRGIATPLGLNSIAGPWVESIQLTKGIGSVAHGYESIAGQINIELKKPENSEKMYANLYVNEAGKTDLNLNLSKKIGKRWSVGLLLHDDFLTNKKLDFNKDGFRDLPTGNQFSFINRWKYENNKGFLLQMGVKLLNDKRTGGAVAFDPARDKNTTNQYGLGIATERYEAFAKIGYVFPAKKYKSIGLQVAAISHQQDAYFGFTAYNAKQQNMYANIIYQSIIHTTNHKFRTGISFLYDQYDEKFKSINFKRTETVPGAFFEYTYTWADQLSVVAGIRADYNSLFGFFLTPRLHIRYEPVKGTTIRLSVGRGQRTANIFAENMSVFVSARQLQIVTNDNGKAYGLNAEVAWNKGISVDQKFKAFSRDGMLSIDFFRNDFNNQVVADVEDPRTVKFYNLQGPSYSNSFQAELSLEPVKKLDLRLAYRYFDVKVTYGTKLLQRPLLASHRAFLNLAYAIKGWKFDYTINYNGRKRIPGTQSNPVAYQRDGYSPGFIIMNAQISKTIGKKYPMDFYIGGENLSGFIQKDVIVAAHQPFGNYFDASLVWGPVTGRMIYAGWRFKLK